MAALFDIVYAAAIVGGFCFVLVVFETVFEICYKRIPAFHKAVDRFIDSTLD